MLLTTKAGSIETLTEHAQIGVAEFPAFTLPVLFGVSRTREARHPLASVAPVRRNAHSTLRDNRQMRQRRSELFVFCAHRGLRAIGLDVKAPLCLRIARWVCDWWRVLCYATRTLRQAPTIPPTRSTKRSRIVEAHRSPVAVGRCSCLLVSSPRGLGQGVDAPLQGGDTRKSEVVALSRGQRTRSERDEELAMSSLKAGLVAIVGIWCVASTAVAESVTFTREAPVIGTTIEDSRHMSMKLGLSLATKGSIVQQMKREQSEMVKFAATILEVNDVAASKVKVSYGKVQESVSMGEDATPKLSPVSNRSYVVADSSTGVIDVSRADGSEPTKEEVEAVRSDFSTLGQPDEFEQLFDGRAFPIGSSLPVPDGLLTGAMGEEFATGSCELILSEVRDGLAVITMTMSAEMGMADAGMTGKVELAGEMLVQPKGSRVLSMRLEGPVLLQGALNENGMEFNLEAKGTMKLERSATYSTARN